MTLTAGQGIAFDDSFDRYYDELTMILTDCKTVDFFQMYDRFGRGFAAQGNWARQQVPMDTLDRVGFAHERGTSDGVAAYPPGADRAPAEEPAECS